MVSLKHEVLMYARDGGSSVANFITAYEKSL